MFKLSQIGLSLVLVLTIATSGLAQGTRTRFHLEEATIAGIQSAIRGGQITTVGLVELYLKRIKAYNGTCVNEPQGHPWTDHDDSECGPDQRALHAQSATGHADEMGIRRSQGAQPDRSR